MVENRPWLTVFSHLVLILGIGVVVLPLWVTLVSSTHAGEDLLRSPIPMWFGNQMFENYSQMLSSGMKHVSGQPLTGMMLNSLIMALSIAIGKIAISLIAAFAICYFRFPFRMTCFWMIFITLMLPVEVRILPTYEVIANVFTPLTKLLALLGYEGTDVVIAGFSIDLDVSMLDSYAGLTLPLIASATATFLFRQFFLTVPDELTEAARIDGAGPMKFFRDILLPLSRTNIAALFVILFIYGWNQYLWPLLVTTDPSYATIVMGIQRMVNVADIEPQWNLVMAASMLAMLPPVAIVIGMQRLFVKGLVETEK
ncbi:ABC transporter permease subunit [Thalassobaculum sp.]|uniref:ABC transporter permease subunit n=1 Tax=Thalassobaculum sp. TaxID=2022740 RepID=UPI0032EF1795